MALGEDGIYANAPQGSIHIDMSSIRPDVAAGLYDAGKAVGVRVMDAPVSGGEPGAIEGTLSIMVGGDRADFDAGQPILDTVGTTVVLVGPPGSGQTVKAANQLIVAGNIELVAEAIVFLRAYGVDTEAAVSVLAGGLAGSRILERKAASMLAGNFEPGFRIDLHHKDMGIVTTAARERESYSARRTHRTADGGRPGARRRQSGPFGPAAWRRTTLGAYALMMPEGGRPGASYSRRTSSKAP